MTDEQIEKAARGAINEYFQPRDCSDGLLSELYGDLLKCIVDRIEPWHIQQQGGEGGGD